MSSDFDVLRREASKLERQLEDRLSKYQQLAQRITSSSNASNKTHSGLLDSMEHGASNGAANPTLLFQEDAKLSSEISRLLQQCTEMNHRMAKSATKQQHDILVKRCREVTYDFQSDFTKVRQNVQRRKDAMELFGSANSSTKTNSGNNNEGDMEHLLRERNHVSNSLHATSAILGQASDTFGELKHQRRSLTGVSGKVMQVAQSVPGLNRVMEAIRQKRNKDDLIVAGVIAACVVFTLWYLLA